MQMVGRKSKAVVPKIKPVHGKKQSRGTQRTMDAFRTVNTVNQAQAQGQVSLQDDGDDVYYKAIVQSEGTEWVDVSVRELTSQDSRFLMPNHGVLTQTNMSMGTEMTTNSHSWADVASVSLPSGLTEAGSGMDFGKSDGPAMQHKTDIPPIFLGYARVCAAGECIPLIQITEVVLKAMGTDNVLDAV